MRALFSRTPAGRSRTESPAACPVCLQTTLRISDICIDTLQPVSERGTGLTKAGRLSLRGRIGTEPVKIYSCLHSKQVQLRLAIQQHTFQGVRFPEVIAHEGNIVVERWIDGDTVTDTQNSGVCDAVTTFLLECAKDKCLHDLAARHCGAFCYIEFLFGRIKPWQEIDAVRTVADTARQALDAHSALLPNRLTHPDLSAANLVVERQSQQLYIVDNELLGVGKGWLIDHHNSLLARRGLPDPRPLGTQDKLLAERLWRLRCLGSALHAGDYRRVNAILDEPQA